MIRVGTCGWAGLRPDEYFETFDAVELKTVPLATARRWRAAASEGFDFTLRADRAITHPPDGEFRDTPGVRRAWKQTLELAGALDTRIIVFKNAGGFRPTDENVANVTRFFQWAHRDRLRLGWEAPASWPDEQVRHLCRELSLTHVTDPFVRPCMRPRPPYFRLHGVGGHQGTFTDDQLAELQATCETVAAAPTPPEPVAWCLFSNASMTDDARRFQAGVSRPA